VKDRGEERDNSVTIVLEESFSGHRISMSGSDTEALCSKSAFGGSICVQKVLAKLSTFLEKLLILFKEQRYFSCPSKHLHEQGETGRACRFQIAERLSSS